VRLRLTPRGSPLYELLTTLAQDLVRAADQLAQLLGADPEARAELAERLREVEQAADEKTHAIIRDLNQTFVTPLDRDDIYRLASSLDDCVDAMEEAGDRIVLYQVDRLPSGVLDQMSVLQRAAELTAQAMPRLRRPAGLTEYWVEINRLENEADRTYRTLLAELYSGTTDPIRLMKLKEIVDTLERAADAFERVAGTVETIALKES
jgi:predicted phosphate transport protein (TIGR00153 family)